MGQREVELPALGLFLVQASDGMAVASVDHDGAAAQSGQVAVGDTVIAINDIGIHDKEPQEIQRLGDSVDHRGQCRLHLVSTNGRETVVVLNFQEHSPAKTLPNMPAGPPVSTVDPNGVGLSIAVQKGVPIVTELFPWGSARWSGKIGVGDEIAAVHGFPVSTLSAQQIADLIDDPSQADGSVISIAIRRKGRPHEPPITVTLARSPPLDADIAFLARSSKLPPERKRDYLNDANAPPRQRDAVPDVTYQPTQGGDAWNPINWATDLVSNRKKPPPFGADTAVLAESSKLPQERKRDFLHAAALNTGQDTLLRSALEQLLDYVKNVSHESPNIDGRHLNIFQQIDSLPECPYDVGLVRQIKDAVKNDKKELRETVQIVRQSQENLDRRKEHIIKLASQLKEAEEMRHRDLKANNVWMQSELKQERDTLAAEKKRLEEALRDQHQELLTRAVQDVNKTTQEQLAMAVSDVERGVDAYRKKLDDAYAAKLKEVQESVDEIQQTAWQKTAMLKDLQSENAVLKQEIIKLQGVNNCLKEKISHLERELSKLQIFMDRKELKTVAMASEIQALSPQPHDRERKVLPGDHYAPAPEKSLVPVPISQAPDSPIAIDSGPIFDRPTPAQMLASRGIVPNNDSHRDISDTQSKVPLPSLASGGKPLAPTAAKPPTESLVPVPISQAPGSRKAVGPTGDTSGFVGGRDIWNAFILEGQPEPASPDLFIFRGRRCNQPYYDENKVCEVRDVDTDTLLYRGNGIHGLDHSDHSGRVTI